MDLIIQRNMDNKDMCNEKKYFITIRKEALIGTKYFAAIATTIQMLQKGLCPSSLLVAGV